MNYESSLYIWLFQLDTNACLQSSLFENNFDLAEFIWNIGFKNWQIYRRTDSLKEGVKIIIIIPCNSLSGAFIINFYLRWHSPNCFGEKFFLKHVLILIFRHIRNSKPSNDLDKSCRTNLYQLDLKTCIFNK